MDVIQEAIKKLIIARRNAQGDQKKQDYINSKLSKLYNMQYQLNKENIKK